MHKLDSTEIILCILDSTLASRFAISATQLLLYAFASSGSSYRGFIFFFQHLEIVQVPNNMKILDKTEKSNRINHITVELFLICNKVKRTSIIYLSTKSFNLSTWIRLTKHCLEECGGKLKAWLFLFPLICCWLFGRVSGYGTSHGDPHGR